MLLFKPANVCPLCWCWEGAPQGPGALSQSLPVTGAQGCVCGPLERGVWWAHSSRGPALASLVFFSSSQSLKEREQTWAKALTTAQGSLRPLCRSQVHLLLLKLVPEARACAGDSEASGCTKPSPEVPRGRASSAAPNSCSAARAVVWQS